MRFLSLGIGISLLVSPVVGDQSGQSRNKPPETFSANAHAVKSGSGAAATTLRIHIERYTRDDERERVLQELKSGGSAALSAALHKAPAVGYLEVGDKKWTIRFARQQTVPKGRRIVAVIDEPIFFLGGGQVKAKPREGYDVAVVQFEVDDVGLGTGTVAAAAKVKAGGPGGVEVEDYAEEPIKLITVRKLIS